MHVETPTRYVIVEVETAGGVTNLVKYWYCFQNQLIDKPIVLLHIYNTVSENDYGSHILLWDYLWSQMTKDLEGRMKAKIFKVGRVNELPDALRYFEEAITDHI